MNAAVTTMLGLALAAVAGLALLFGSGLITAQVPGAGVMGGVGTGFEYGGYLALTLVNVGLGTVVAWMLFGKTE